MYKLDIPEIESPLYPRRKEATEYSPDLDRNRIISLNNEYHIKGYEVMDLLSPGECDQIIQEVDNIISSGDFKFQNKGYQYSDSPRVFEAWKQSRAVLEAARHPKILERLEQMYGRKPLPFQTINFKKGSNQPLHSDVIHFHTMPHRWVVGVWIALEDMDEYNGTLRYVPGSHTLPIYELQDLGIDKVDPQLPKEDMDREQVEKYRSYEMFIDNLVWSMKLKEELFLARKGQALLWMANLLHGGAPIRDPQRTRWSQATHYYFEGCEHYYAPMFSNPRRGEYAEKDLSKKDILNHTIEVSRELIHDFE